VTAPPSPRGGFATPAEYVIERRPDGSVCGPWRRLVNPHADRAGSIHDPAMATVLGFRGAPIAGSFLLDLLPPLLVAGLGASWWREGSLEVWFRQPLTEGEAVRACTRATVGDPQRLEVELQNEAGEAVATGTAGVGGAARSTLLNERIARVQPPSPGALRILKDLRPGHSARGLVERIGRDAQQRLHAHLVEPCPEYAPAAGGVLAPSLVADLAYYSRRGVLEAGRDYGVDLFGALGMAFHRGPLRVDVDYRLDVDVLAVGETPRTEFYWLRTVVHDARGDEPCATLLAQMRYMKGTGETAR
jgi:hypothetical protein